MKKPYFLAPLLGLLAQPTVAHAQDQAVISTARELAKQAFQAYDEGRYEEAADKSLKAYQVVRVPTLAVNRARALVKLGRLLAASELYLEATRLPRDPSWQAIQDEAIGNAERERAELLPRIPRMKIIVSGAEATEVAVSIDDRNVPSALLDTEQMVDPGQRVVVGSYRDQKARELAAPKEGEQLQVTLRFTAAAPIDAAPVSATTAVVPPATATKNAAPAAAIKTTSPQTDQVKPEQSFSTLALLGWTGVGLGGAGVIFGAIEGLNAMSKRDSLIATGQCSSNGERCPESFADRVESYRGARTLSTVGFYAGGILAAAGVTLLVLPAKKEAPTTIGLVLGPSYIGVCGGLL